MRRRTLLAALGAAFAGCSGSDGTSTASAFDGPAREDDEAVDIQWRDWSAEEVEAKKADAKSVRYPDLMRDIETYTGETVHFPELQVVQVFEPDPEDTYIFGLATRSMDPDIMFGSWIGERFVTDDIVEVWGHVLGIESYQTARGAANTVPALSVIDVDLLEKA